MNSPSYLGDDKALVPLEGQHLRYHFEVETEPSLDTKGTDGLILAFQPQPQRTVFQMVQEAAPMPMSEPAHKCQPGDLAWVESIQTQTPESTSKGLWVERIQTQTLQ